MSKRTGRFRFVLAPLFALLLGSCADSREAGPLSPAAESRGLLGGGGGAGLLECPVSTTESTSAVIGPLGGLLSLGGHQVLVPANAVLSPTPFTLTIPQGNHLKIRLTAGEQEHFTFLQPVVLTLSYARCNRNLLAAPLQVLYVDSNGAVLENLGGVDNKLTRTVTTATLHFSDYALGQP